MRMSNPLQLTVSHRKTLTHRETQDSEERTTLSLSELEFLRPSVGEDSSDCDILIWMTLLNRKN
jgi:hypothetical protein